jgi:hypothetical protein
MSRMACSGTRISRFSRWPEGLTNARTVTSLGMSWAKTAGVSVVVIAAKSTAKVGFRFTTNRV